ncbi:DUF421 domain-containing protein [Sporosarcina sp. 179-K 3D1 HS]|uniref:DUF421 domain-containing protein n=1 Tax=Sporosarcina sp. 179-K 3D1 HS TaxID=3232169 RepID=UPI0039A2A839
MEYLTNGAKLIIGLVAFIIVLRMLGKKHLAEMTPYDIIYLLIFGGILEETLYDSKITIQMFLFSLVVWAVAIYLVEKIVVRSNLLRMWIKGSPDKLIADGKLNKKLMDKNQMEMEQLRTMLRQQGIFSLRQVRDLYIEPGGDISINQYAAYQPVTIQDLQLEKEEEEPTVLLVDEGQVKPEVLEFIGKTEDWLRDQLEKLGHREIRTIHYCEWSSTEGFFIRTYDQAINID